MKRTYLLIASIVCACTLSVTAQVTLLVPDEYPAIQDAIDSSDSGDTILIAPGTYVENLEILWPIKIAAMQTDSITVTIQSDTWDLPAVSVWTDDAESPVILSYVQISGAWAERGVLVSGLSSISVLSCDIRGNLVGLEAADQSNTHIQDSTFSENSETCIQGNGSAKIDVFNTVFNGSLQSHMVRTPFGHPVVMSFDGCSFHGDRSDPRDIGIYAGPYSYLTVTNSFFEKLGTGIETHSAEVFLAQNNEIDRCDGGIWIWNSEDGRTEARILGNTITNGSSGICLAGHVVSVEIADNKIMYCGNGVNVQLPLCGGGEVPFSGIITGTGNIMRGITNTPCPPYTTPFWPEGFVK